MSERLLTFVHLSDTHIHIDPDHTNDHTDFSSRHPVQRLIETVNSLPMDIDFVMHTGDVTHHPETPEHYQEARKILNELARPVFYVPGNHDNVAMFQHDFLRVAPENIRPHLDYEFEINGIQVIMLDSHISPNKPDNHNGMLEGEQLQWLAERCTKADDRPLVVGLHHHPIPMNAPWLDRIVLANGDALHAVLLQARDRLRGVFYGHIHESVVAVRDGISYYSVQSGWFQTRTWFGAESPEKDNLQEPGFNVVTLTERDTFIRFHRVTL